MRFSVLLIASVAAAHVMPIRRHEEAEASVPAAAASGSGMAGMSGMQDANMTMEPSPASSDHHHGRTILEDPSLEPQQRAYWEQYSTLTFFSSPDGSKFLLWSHTLLVVTAYGLMAPISLLTCGDSRAQWFYIPFQTVQSGLALLGLLCFALYAATAPKLYPGNSYSGFSIAMVVLEAARWLAVVLRAITSYLAADNHPYLSANNDSPFYDNAGNLGPGNVADERPRRMSSSLSSTEGAGSETELSSFDIDRENAPKIQPLEVDGQAPRGSKLVARLAENRIFARLNAALGGVASFFYHLLTYPMFLVGYSYLLTGLATAFLMGKGHAVYALLAHFIKGFVFFLLGYVELARYLGAGSRSGWGWNEVYVSKTSTQTNGRRGLYILQQMWPEYPTVEFIQSFLCFFYGATNVFLEHLGNNDGGKWSHKDLQHVSIAFMFFGGGLCGMVLESPTVKALAEVSFGLKHEESSHFVRRGWSYNPMPAVIVFWTGALMSHHEQETALSTAVHIQWGTMLSLGGVFRLVTLLLLKVKPRPLDHAEAERPQRPFSEVIVSFFLICGGMIFMASNRESVEGMIYRGLDQMFTLNVSVGITVLMMAYFVCCVAVKGWASSRYQ